MTVTGFDPESSENKFARQTRELVATHIEQSGVKILSFDKPIITDYIAYLATEFVKPPAERTIHNTPESARFPLSEELHSIINCYFMQVVAGEPTYETRIRKN